MKKLLKDMLVGNLLCTDSLYRGDASIRRTGLNKAYITFEQSGKKSEYLNYLFNLAKEHDLPLMSETVSLGFFSYLSPYGVQTEALAICPRTEYRQKL